MLFGVHVQRIRQCFILHNLHHDISLLTFHLLCWDFRWKQSNMIRYNSKNTITVIKFANRTWSLSDDDHQQLHAHQSIENADVILTTFGVGKQKYWKGKEIWCRCKARFFGQWCLAVLKEYMDWVSCWLNTDWCGPIVKDLVWEVLLVKVEIWSKWAMLFTLADMLFFQWNFDHLNLCWMVNWSTAGFVWVYFLFSRTGKKNIPS